ncbi:S1C family serine protease [Thioalkalivibrio sulfidiphilus]|uniref:S1C family serine protease n=1 Tax=Thioalkalivibrio sulfidiphilus TaxID=1033854 RepID=UPI003BAF4FB3
MPRFLACLLSLLILASAATQAADLADLFERVNPSVVVIQSQEQVARGTDQLAWRTIQRVGSGGLVSGDGRIVTAAHVVQSADQIQVSFADGSTVDARVIGSEPAADIALLKVEAVPASAAVARLGDSDGVRIGQPVFAIGAPHGLAHALSVGHISARHRGSDITGDFGLGELLQTDASLNRGNSGGPLFNHSGEVVGIVSRILTSSGGSQGLGFAVTSNQVRELLLEQRAFWNGLNGYWVQGNLARLLNIPQARGLLVQGMASGSPAARIGLRAGTVEVDIAGETLILGGDVILSVADISFADEDGYQRVRQHLGGLNPGDSVTISVLRAGERITLATRLGEAD